MTPIVEVNGLRATEDAIEEVDEDGRVLVGIPRRDVVALRLEEGVVAERPVLGFVLGGGLTLFGLWVGIALVRYLLEPGGFVGRRVAYLLTASVMSLLIGAWLIHRARRRGPYVAVELQADRRKLAFGSDVPRDDAAQFIRALTESPLWSPLVR